MIHPTPREKLLDARRRPCFLWDCDLTLEDFLANLRHPEREVRAYWIGKLMRQAKPDDVFQFVTRQKVEEHWDALERYLGWSREFWAWILALWKADGEIHVDSRHEILVNKLCALLGRAELRDLVDLRLLLETGGDLERGLEDAPARDGGFSAMTLAWVLKGLPLAALARTAHIDEAETERPVSFRDGLIRA